MIASLDFDAVAQAEPLLGLVSGEVVDDLRQVDLLLLVHGRPARRVEIERQFQHRLRSAAVGGQLLDLTRHSGRNPDGSRRHFCVPPTA